MASACYVYAIVNRGWLPPANMVGLDDAPLETVPCGGLTAAISRLGGAPTPTRDHLLRHESVVEDICRAGAALPVRFGTILPDPLVVARALADRYTVLTDDLRRLGGKVEFGVTVLWETADRVELEGSPDLSVVGPGSRYLAARIAAHRHKERLRSEAAALGMQLEGALGGHALDSRSIMLTTPRLPFRGAYLVEQSAVCSFREAFARARSDWPTLHFLLSGPWPPYSFVTPPGDPNPAPRFSPQGSRCAEGCFANRTRELSGQEEMKWSND